ncbi:MAG: amidohydrolase [Hyphomicrobiales bacterium]|nr:amidohydrolase [Hyphomicrobiales bacterium]
MSTTVFEAKKVITMDPNCPEATHVAVREGRILAVGDLKKVSGWGPYSLDDSFKDKTILPGFVEGHAHLLAGGMWKYLYVGYQDRVDPDGKLWKGVVTIEDVLERLAQEDANLPSDVPLIAWGFDPIFLMDTRPDKSDFDKISKTRPIVVMHSNFHVMTVNSASLLMAQYDANTNVDGIAKDTNGEPNGELQEMAAMFPLMRRLGIDFRELGRTQDAVEAFGRVCNRVGVTTATDLINELDEEAIAGLKKVTEADGCPIRLVPMLNGLSQTPADTAKRALELKELSTDNLHLGGVKLVTDGSIQAFTARLRWPGYYNGAPNGIWNIAPQQLNSMVDTLNENDIAMHIHTNGDEAVDAALDAVEIAIKNYPNPDHRITLQHCQMADKAQFQRMKKLGVCVNLFSNHIYYFGDQHAAITIGPDRAERMDGTRSALDHNIPLAIHSDAPVTPMGPLTCAWAASNRITTSGAVLGARECISVEEALHAVTLGPAYTLKMDGKVGSIEVGKWADFVILEDDPTSVDPRVLNDIEVWGTVLGGVHHKIPQ